MDSRALRSRTALVDAAYRLASERDIDELTVTDVTAAAGISRDTFYRHASDPVDLVATALHAELAEALAAYLAMPATLVGAEPGTSVFAEPTRVFVQHVRAHAEIYRRSSRGGLSSRLRAVLTDAAEEVLSAHLRRHPEIVPASLAPLDEVSFAMTVAYAAGGTVAATEAWLVHGDLDDIDGAVRVVLATAPSWWLGLG
ncbi:TetR/AcrR family transcriptional regulator [Herbiconiux moechotypicola]|uniref:HTH tetR-type domain-containing protein n=1 Tax=Herbiconiux moechotypicola TaxID=637393 RepID=A0ABP5QE24_9MICO|nr:TetR/AcrR family transcriptional regulator [Herbiconiux moechotypicola]MCS5729837.1 TetR/AcrR family transcriptional regulator [Herbiconiux moechotypicola]